MGSEQAREVLAEAYAHFEMHDTAKALVSVDSLNLHQEAAIRAITTAREQALREALQGLRMLALVNGETASADWHNGVQAAIGEVSRLSLMERKA